MNYKIKNSGNANLSWRAYTTVDWLNIENTSISGNFSNNNRLAIGVLSPGQETFVSISLSGSVNSFTPGKYYGSIEFQNLNNMNEKISRSASLTIEQPVTGSVSSSKMEVLPDNGISFTGPVGGPYVLKS
jgi:hypothetical protein